MSMVSVVVATYKRDESLVIALESLANQTYDDFEIILVDDNGEINRNAVVSAIVSDFRKKHPDIKLEYIVNSPNQGSAKTRNIGINASKGEYVTFLDDDDLYLPKKISKQVAFMVEHCCDYCVTDLELFNENDKLIDRRTRSYIKDTSPESMLKYHLMHHITGTDTMMFKKEYIDKIGGFAPIDVGDEFYLMQRAIDGGGKFGYLPACDVKAYVHTGDGGLSSGEGKIAGEKALYAYKKKYFKRISSSDRRFIRMRHYAVLAFAEVRRKKYFKFIFDAVLSFLCAPIACVKMVLTKT